MPSPEKFKETLVDFALDEALIREINTGYEDLVSRSNKKLKSAYFKQALDVMNEKLPRERVQEIFEANACCGGHFKYYYEIMLGVKLKRAKIVSSPHDTDGEKPCAFRYEIL